MKKLRFKKARRTVETSLKTAKVYLRKPATTIVITAYAIILVLVLATIGFSKLINSKPSDPAVPSLPETDDFAFLPADNLEVPTLGEPTNDAPKESTPETNTSETSEPETSAPETATYSAPAVVYTPVVVEKEVIKEVPKEIVKTVEKEVIKTVEVEKEIPVHIENENPPAAEPINLDNYDTPEIEPPANESADTQEPEQQ